MGEDANTNPNSPSPGPAGSVTEIVYTWPDGREEVRYRRPKDSESALLLIEEIIAMTKRLGTDIQYSYRHVPSPNK